MALKGRQPKKLATRVKQIAGTVQETDVITENENQKKRRLKELPGADNVVQVQESGASTRKTSDFAEITLTGSKGQSYVVTVPASYVDIMPKQWKWTADRYRIAELIAQGLPISQIPDHPDVQVRSRMTIYGWLEHPEFKAHIDGLILETGWASRRERLNNLQRINDVLLHKLMREIDGVKLTDKSLGAILSALQAGSKLIAQEKGEFIEESKVTQDTNVTAAVTVGAAKVEELLASKSAGDRKEMEAAFDQIGDEIISSIVSGK